MVLEEMIEQKICACRGIRRCALCRPNRTSDGSSQHEENQEISASYCYKCHSMVINSSSAICDIHVATCLGGRHESAFPLDRMLLYEDFVTEEEEKYLTQEIENHPWVDSQSGRRKQDFGPKVNFKKQKLNMVSFSGLPRYSKFVLDRMHQLHFGLNDFSAVELCNLKYSPDRGAHIEPHTDDAWLWGNRLISLNLCSDTFLTLTPTSREILPTDLQNISSISVKAAMPRRSLFVIKDDARYLWNHSVEEKDVLDKRIVMTFRELSDEFLFGGQKETGQKLLEIAENFI